MLVATAPPPRPTTTPFTLSVVPTLVRLEAVTPDASVAPVNVDALATLAVVAKDDVSGVNVIDVAADAVVAKDDVIARLDVTAKDAVVANDADVAKLAVPNSEPLNEPTEPVDTFTIARTNILDCDGGATKNDKVVLANV